MRNKENGIKYFIIVIGWIFWLPLAYFSFVGINKLVYWIHDMHIIVIIIFNLLVFVMWSLQLHKLFLSMFYVSLQIKWVHIIYSILGLLALLIYFLEYNQSNPIFLSRENIQAILQKSEISELNKGLTGGVYIFLMLIFIPNYLLYPLITKQVK